MEVQTNDAGSQGEILLNPGSYFLLDNALSFRTSIQVVIKRQEICRILGNTLLSSCLYRLSGHQMMNKDGKDCQITKFDNHDHFEFYSWKENNQKGVSVFADLCLRLLYK